MSTNNLEYVGKMNPRRLTSLRKIIRKSKPRFLQIKRIWKSAVQIDVMALAKLKKKNQIMEPSVEYGYLKLFSDTLTQADKDVGFDFLRAFKADSKTPK